MSAVLNYATGICEMTGYDHIEIEHDGSITWLEMQVIKNEVWGESAVALEM